MKKSLTVSAILGSSLLALSISALAQSAAKPSSSVNGDSGIYLGGNLGVGEAHYSSTLSNGLSIGNREYVWGLNGGYQFTPHVAAEVGHVTYFNVTAGALVRYNTNYVAVKGMLPFSSGIVLFAKAGTALISSHADFVNLDIGGSSASTLYGAMGMGYNFTPAIQANLQVDSTTKSGNKGDDHYAPAMHSATLGLSYLFNT